VAINGSRDYRVFDRAIDVPTSLLRQPGVIVERFLPDVDEGVYHTHMYLFLGDGSAARGSAVAMPSSRPTTTRPRRRSSRTPRLVRGARSSGSTTARSATPSTTAR
jgi:hypothetical protein